MSDEYTPVNPMTDISVRESFVYAQLAIRGVDTNTIGTSLTVALSNAWDEWLAEHDREVAAKAVDGSTSDGHHTFDELYEYRMLYNVHAALGWLALGIPVVKSWRHSDGELAFGGGWFIVSAQLSSGQVTNHYKAEHWELFEVPEVEIAPAWDGHTPAIVAERLLAAVIEQAKALLSARHCVEDDHDDALATLAAADTDAALREHDAKVWAEGYSHCFDCPEPGTSLNDNPYRSHA